MPFVAKKLLLSAFVFVLPFAVLEGAARWFLGPLPDNLIWGANVGEIEDAALLWRNRPKFGVRRGIGPHDRRGLRRPDRPLKPKSTTLRLLSLGESTTYGAGLAWDETYSHVAEQLLRAKGHSIEILNAGTRTWSTLQSLRYLEQAADDLQPDAVLFYHEINDFLPTTWRAMKAPGAGMTDKETMASAARSVLGPVLRHSVFIRRARAWSARRMVGTGSTAGFEDRAPKVDAHTFALLPDQPAGEVPFMTNPNPLVRVPDVDRAQALEELADFTQRRGIKLLIVHPAYPVSKPHRCLLNDFAERRDLPVLEAETLFLEAASRRGLTKLDFFQADPFHPNAMGHRVLAHSVARFVQTHLADDLAARRQP